MMCSQHQSRCMEIGIGWKKLQEICSTKMKNYEKVKRLKKIPLFVMRNAHNKVNKIQLGFSTFWAFL